MRFAQRLISPIDARTAAARPRDGLPARRHALAAGAAVGLLATLAAAGVAWPLAAQAQSTPATPAARESGRPAGLPDLVRIVVPFAAGGSNDQIARVVAPALAKRLETSVIVENRPGAGSVVGSDYVAKAAPDGSVLLLNSSSFLTAAATQPKTPFDPIRSFAPIAMIGEGPMLLAIASSARYQTPADLLTAARARPNAVSYGSSGIGSIAQLTTEMLAADAGATMLHVPYKGAAPALLDLVGGQIDLMISNYSSLAAQIQTGKVRPLAVTSATASPAFPNLPPLGDTVPGFGVNIWVGVFAPAGTPAALVARLNRELGEIAASPEVRALLEPDGAKPATLLPDAFADRVRRDFDRWKQIATDKQIVAQ